MSPTLGPPRTCIARGNKVECKYTTDSFTIPSLIGHPKTFEGHLMQMAGESGDSHNSECVFSLPSPFLPLSKPCKNFLFFPFNTKGLGKSLAGARKKKKKKQHLA